MDEERLWPLFRLSISKSDICPKINQHIPSRYTAFTAAEFSIVLLLKTMEVPVYSLPLTVNM